MKHVFFYETSIGTIGIAENGTAITNIFFGNMVLPKEYQEKETVLIKEASQQIRAYLDGKRKKFELLLEPEGTEFEKSVWNALVEIPYGQTKSYGEIAKQIDRPKASRAVGRANGRNPIGICIPCHRVIGSDGSLTGYAGGIEIKQYLLELEKVK